jgi:N6-adenosine-specific RNA methylase IME4
MAPEHVRLARYETMTFEAIQALPVGDVCAEKGHLYLWVPNALLAEGIHVMEAWGFTYKTNLVWFKTRKDGGPDGRGVGFYFRNVTELVLFGIRGKDNRTLAPGRRQVNLFAEQKREHSRKPEQLYDIIESCSPGPYLELFARHGRDGWRQWGNEVVAADPGSPVAGLEDARESA